MSSMKVDADELELEDPLFDDQGLLHRGQRFTGTRVERTPAGIFETPIVDGAAHGRLTLLSHEGVLLEEAFFDCGRAVGERRCWWPSGQLRSHVHVGPPRRERAWNEAGQLVLERDDGLQLRRVWLDGGQLRSERLGEVTHEYLDGRLAWSRGRRSPDDPRTYAAYTFVAEVLHVGLERLVAEHDREYDVFIWVHSLIANARDEAVGVLRRLLGNDSLWVRSTALALAGNARLVELRPEIEAALGDARVPPAEAHGSTRRSATRSLGEVAHVALSQLG